MNNASIWVTGLGASTPVGRDAAATAAAVRCGIDGFVAHPYMISLAGEPIHAAIAPWLEIDLAGLGRFEALLYPAIDQVLAPLRDFHGHSFRLALSLGLPAPRPGLDAELRPALLRAIAARYEKVFTATAAFPIGHAGGLCALEVAATEIAHGRFDACIVAGVDSYIDPETFEWLEAHDQLHGGGPNKYAWGFIPGEAAGAILLARRAMVERLNLDPLAQLLGLGMAFEPKAIKAQTVCVGEGLTAAVRGALRTLPDGAKVTDLYCDMNGEPYRADEYGFATLRVSERYEQDMACETPADCLGDVGAASGVVFALLASIGSAKGYSRGPYALIFCGSEGGERGAALLHMTAQEAQRSHA